MNRLLIFDLPISITSKLIKDIPNLYFSSSINKIEKNYNKDDLVLFYNYSYRKSLYKFENVNPNHTMSKLCENRIDQLTILDTITKYPLTRTLLKDHSGFINLEENKMYKVGNTHQGKDKYTFPEDKKLRVYHEDLVVEEFITGRSIRILFIGDNIFGIEHISDNKIKNINPEEIIIDPPKELIEDAKTIKNYLESINAKSLTIGIDYVYSKDKIGFLELNDMCGIPEELNETFINEIIKLTKEY